MGQRRALCAHSCTGGIDSARCVPEEDGKIASKRSNRKRHEGRSAIVAKQTIIHTGPQAVRYCSFDTMMCRRKRGKGQENSIVDMLPFLFYECKAEFIVQLHMNRAAGFPAARVGFMRVYFCRNVAGLE